MNTKTFEKLRGAFYEVDCLSICDCEEVDDRDVFTSKKYPAVHGCCGRWTEKYKWGHDG